MENPKVLALRLHAREGGRGELIAQILARPKGRHVQHPQSRPKPTRIPQPMREQPTPRQLQVINAVSHGMNYEDTAVILGMAHETVKVHMRNAKLRCAAKTRPHLIAICLREGWIH